MLYCAVLVRVVCMGLVVLTAVVMFVVCGGPMLDSTFLIGGVVSDLPTPGKPGNPDNPEWVIEVAAALVHGGGDVAV